MKAILIILLFIVFFSGISKERKIWVGFSLGTYKTNTDGFVWMIAAEDKEEATNIFLRDRKKYDGVYKFKILNGDGLKTDYNVWEITDSILHKK